MKLATLILAGLALGAPVTASAAGICDQITGTYISGRVGTLKSVPGAIVFDRVTLRAGVSAGNGDQVSTSTGSPVANHLLIKAAACIPLTANSARITLATATPGTNVFIDAASMVATVFDGGNRVWIVGSIEDAKLPGWLLRVPANPAGL
ncbi:MAG: hypothetical protein V4574_18085 [Pseudomonadota bacterium]